MKTFDSTLEFNYIEHILDKYTIFYLYMYFFNVTEKLRKKITKFARNDTILVSFETTFCILTRSYYSTNSSSDKL